MTDAILDALESLKKSAAQRQVARNGKTRVVVQVGHCSQAVGASDVADAVSNALPDNAYMVIAGCDGACFAAPRVVVTQPNSTALTHSRVDASVVPNILSDGISPSVAGDADFLAGQHRLTLDCCGEIDALDIGEYILNGGYDGLARALSSSPEEVIEDVLASGLRGRGGAYFPAALKWRGARAVRNTPRYLVVNCEEGEPGIFKDRHIMEGVPHRLIEGAIIAAYTSEVHDAYIYINAEANLSAERMQSALEQAYANGLLGENILSSGFALEMRIMRGAGGYVCGDETTLLNTMEGQRREPRQRPPFPTEAGLVGNAHRHQQRRNAV